MSSCLSDRTLDVSYVLTDGAGDEVYARLFPQLPPEEQARANQFLLLKDRLAFSVGRSLVRRLLSQYSAAPPGGWRFGLNAYGKPAIVPSPGTPDLRFNLSHSTGVVVAAIALARDIGVDVEFVAQEVDFLDLARAQFTAGEIELLEALPKEGQRHTFFALWTLKEAYTKARGVGLSVSLSEFAFDLDPPTISSTSQLAKDPDNWFFWQDQLSPSHQLAIAAQRRPGEDLIYCKRQVALRELF